MALLRFQGDRIIDDPEHIFFRHGCGRIERLSSTIRGGIRFETRPQTARETEIAILDKAIAEASLRISELSEHIKMLKKNGWTFRGAEALMRTLIDNHVARVERRAAFKREQEDSK